MKAIQSKQAIQSMSNVIDIRRLNKPGLDKPMPPEGNDHAGEKEPGEKGSAGEKEPAGLWAFMNKDIRFFGSPIPDKVREGFYLELSTLLEAGVDIRSALQLIIGEQSKKNTGCCFPG